MCFVLHDQHHVLRLVDAGAVEGDDEGMPQAAEDPELTSTEVNHL